MPIPQNKEELLAAMRTTHGKLQQDLAHIPIALSLQESMAGHAKDSTMSPFQLIAYLVGWAEVVLEWNLLFESGEEVHFPTEGYKWNELGALAQKFYHDYPQHNFTSISLLLDQRVEEITELIKKKSNEELYKTLWYKNYTMGRMIQLNTSSPYKNARSRIRKWLKENRLD